MIPYGKQDVSQDDIEAVVDVLRSDFLTQGPTVSSFEQSVARYCKAEYGVAANSATSVLHLACIALGLSKGGLLWTTPITFVASANCGLYCEAQVDFVDIDPQTYNLCPQALEQKLIKAKKNGKLPDIVIPVHLCGQSCDMKKIHDLSKEYGFKIIEDASHAIGGRYKKKPIGNCLYSDIVVFSFHPVKIITTGEGGIALTNNRVLADLMYLNRSHGITNDPSKMQSRPLNEVWNYQQISLGFNYRMTDIQAALGLSQITRLDEFVIKRHKIANYYNHNLVNLPLQSQRQYTDSYSSYHLYPVRIKLDEIELTQHQVYEELRSLGICVNLHYIPLYLQPYYELMGFKRGYCAEAEQYYKEVITLPIYTDLTTDKQNQVIEALNKIFSV